MSARKKTSKWASPGKLFSPLFIFRQFIFGRGQLVGGPIRSSVMIVAFVFVYKKPCDFEIAFV